MQEGHFSFLWVQAVKCEAHETKTMLHDAFAVFIYDMLTVLAFVLMNLFSVFPDA